MGEGSRTMASKLQRIAFVWDWPFTFEQGPDWRDGLAAALKILSNKYEVGVFAPGNEMVYPHPYFDIHLNSDIPTAVEWFEPDVILMWGDFTRPNLPKLLKLGIPTAICFAGGETNHPLREAVGHIFVENKNYLKHFEGLPVSVAFGTNEELFRPMDLPKIFDIFFPATFALWKRHSLFAEVAIGKRACAAGYMYPNSHESECYEICQANGVLTLPHQRAETLVYLYNSSNVILVTSADNGGSQRTVLEALACDRPVVVMSDSEKTSEYVLESGVGAVADPTVSDINRALGKAAGGGRQYIMENYTAKHYADALEEEMLNLL
jgi:glycosyltransferase involved in cell wall biosynthesis